MTDMGDLTELEIWHDGTGFGAGWHLDFVEVHSSATGKVRGKGVGLGSGEWVGPRGWDVGGWGGDVSSIPCTGPGYVLVHGECCHGRCFTMGLLARGGCQQAGRRPLFRGPD